jgi:hypothetical protein
VCVRVFATPFTRVAGATRRRVRSSTEEGTLFGSAPQLRLLFRRVGPQIPPPPRCPSLSPLSSSTGKAREISLHTETHTRQHTHSRLRTRQQNRKKEEGGIVYPCSPFCIYIYQFFFAYRKVMYIKRKEFFLRNETQEQEARAEKNERRMTCPTHSSSHAGLLTHLRPHTIETPSFFVFAFFSSLFGAGKREKQKKRTRRKERCVPDIEPDSPAQRLCTHSILHRVYVSESVCVRGSLCVLF